MEQLIGNLYLVLVATATLSAWPIVIAYVVAQDNGPTLSEIFGNQISIDEPASWLIGIPAVLIAFLLMPTLMLVGYGAMIWQVPMLPGSDNISRGIGMIIPMAIGACFGFYYARKLLPKLDKMFNVDSGYTPFIAICTAVYTAHAVHTGYKVVRGASKSRRKRRR